MYSFARWALVAAAVVMSACGSESSDPSCGEQQACVYSSRDAQVCRPLCGGPEAPPCPEGQVCRTGSVCCGGDTRANVCDSPPVQVCCPASGC